MNPDSLKALVNRAVPLLPSGPYDNPRLDALLLLCQAAGISREQYYARMEDNPDPETIERFEALVKRRASGEPMAYIRGSREFWGLDFFVDDRVLIPRPDTETLVEWVLESHDAETKLSVHDCCTGSGAIAISLACECPCWEISASDISTEAGAVFRINWARHRDTLPDPWFRSDLLVPLAPSGKATDPAVLPVHKPQYDIITANPPYLLSQEVVEKQREGWREPLLALDGGGDGLDLVRRLASQASAVLKSGGWLYLEAADNQAQEIAAILEHAGFSQVECRADLAGMRRVTRGALRRTR